MAGKPTITTLPAGAKYDTSTLTGNFQAIRDAFDSMVGRAGTGGTNNAMTGDLDFDGNNILNAGSLGLDSSESRAEAAADSAESSSASADSSKSAAATSADSAESSSTSANSSESSAASSESAANSSESAAAVSADSAESSAVSADSAESTAVTAADSSESSAASVGTSADSAESSSASANSSESKAASSESNAASSESAAAASESKAALAADSAESSAGAIANEDLYALVSTESSNFSVDSDDDDGTLYRVHTGGGNVTMTLPTVAAVGTGFRVAVIKTSSDTNEIIAARQSSDTINGDSQDSVGTQYDAVTYVAHDSTANTWQALKGGGGSADVNIERFTGNASTQSFALSLIPGTENNTQIYIGGVYQQKNTYTLDSKVIGFSTAPVSGDSNIEVMYLSTASVGTPGADTVDNSKLTDSAVDSDILRTGSVILAKLDDSLDSGSMIYWDSGVPQELAIGADSQILTSDSEKPVWTDPAAAGGAWNFISSVSADSSTTLEFTSGIDSTYDMYAFVMSNLSPSVDSAVLLMRTDSGNGSDYDSEAYPGHVSTIKSNSTSYAAIVTQYSIPVSGNIGVGAGDSSTLDGFVYMSHPSSTLHETNFIVQTVHHDGGAGGTPRINFINGGLSTPNTKGPVVAAVEFSADSDKIAIGDIRMYGLSIS